ncbi:MAG: hypothetical protein P4L10_17650 [Acidobacteriaceae bacterium]|nr:hypothetical protein [Acidobacteriaceae bacterium]
MELAKLGLAMLDMPFKKAKEMFYKRDDRDRYERYVSDLLHLMQTASKAQ